MNQTESTQLINSTQLPNFHSMTAEEPSGDVPSQARPEGCGRVTTVVRDGVVGEGEFDHDQVMEYNATQQT